MTRRAIAAPRWLSDQDIRLCVRINRASRIAWVRWSFRAISRLGDGMFWYGLIGAMALWHGSEALPAIGHMAAAGLTATLVYKWLKATTSRPRPYQRIGAVERKGDPLDEFSFPSGHTLHAVVFCQVALHHYPQLAIVLVPFTLLVGVSRVVLGLHYPSDVLAAVLLGVAIAGGSLLLV